jgi:post-segregation antitoxin (ccd killing protein)
MPVSLGGGIPESQGEAQLVAEGTAEGTRVAAEFDGCILRRMPRMQVYLPDDLYELVKERGLPASELLQEAVRAEVRRLELLAASTKYTAELRQQVGAPSASQRARAAEVARRAASRLHRKAG